MFSSSIPENVHHNFRNMRHCRLQGISTEGPAQCGADSKGGGDQMKDKKTKESQRVPWKDEHKHLMAIFNVSELPGRDLLL